MKTRVATLWKEMPTVLLVVAVALTVFGYGVLVGEQKVFPYRVIVDGIKTGQMLFDVAEPAAFNHYIEPLSFSDVPPEKAAANRIRPMAGATLADPLLWSGGHFRFLDLCPDNGCLAVEYTKVGEVAHAWPYRPAELAKAVLASVNDEYPYEHSPTFSLAQDMYPVGVSMYPNRDLLVTFHLFGAFPFQGGIARIDTDGQPVWFQRNYSHHWPVLLADGVGLVPAMRIGTEDISFELANGRPVTVDCSYDRPYIDIVNVIDGQGRPIEQINLVDVLLRSPFAPLLRHTLDPCDPLHLNYVVQLGSDADGSWGMAPSDLVVSLRNLNAFAVIDRETLRLKRLVTGSFFQQHSVTHLEGPTFLLLDNHGSDGTYGPSRLLQIDLSTGRETTIFPNARIPDFLRGLFTELAGKIDISPDRQRAMIVFSQMGTAVEVRLSNGEVLGVFKSLHNVSHVEQFDERRRTQAAIFGLYGLDYVHPAQAGSSN